MNIEEAVEGWPPAFAGSYSDNDIISRSPSTSLIKDVYERGNNIPPSFSRCISN